MQQTWIDFIRIIADTALVILLGYAFARKKINNYKVYILSSLLLAVLTFVIKLLPISDMYPILISSIFAVLILVNINKIYVVKATLSTIICIVLSIISQGFTILIMVVFLGIKDIDSFFNNSNSLTRNIYGIPSLVFFAIVVIISYLVAIRKKDKIKG